MSDLTTIIARIDALQASVQAMANALAAKADKTNLVLDKNNPAGLQSAVQTMANALAAQHASSSEVEGRTYYTVSGISNQTGALVEGLLPSGGAIPGANPDSDDFPANP